MGISGRGELEHEIQHLTQEVFVFERFLHELGLGPTLDPLLKEWRETGRGLEDVVKVLAAYVLTPAVARDLQAPCPGCSAAYCDVHGVRL